MNEKEIHYIDHDAKKLEDHFKKVPKDSLLNLYFRPEYVQGEKIKFLGTFKDDENKFYLVGEECFSLVNEEGMKVEERNMSIYPIDSIYSYNFLENEKV